MTVIDQAHGSTFDDRDVAASYAHRPPYPPELYRFLLTLTSGRGCALDLGCGPGKIARTLAGYFESVEAIDPSIWMIETGRREDAGARPNIDWLTVTAEDAALVGPYDLVTAGASIHWMRHEIVFPKLAAHLQAQGVMAVISGDDVFEADWLADWKAFIADWLQRLGQSPDEQGFAAALRSFEPWMDIDDTRTFVSPFTQDLGAFANCQHSRATWARSQLGSSRSLAFDGGADGAPRPSRGRWKA